MPGDEDVAAAEHELRQSRHQAGQGDAMPRPDRVVQDAVRRRHGLLRLLQAPEGRQEGRQGEHEPHQARPFLGRPPRQAPGQRAPPRLPQAEQVGERGAVLQAPRGAPRHRGVLPVQAARDQRPLPAPWTGEEVRGVRQVVERGEGGGPGGGDLEEEEEQVCGADAGLLLLGEGGGGEGMREESSGGEEPREAGEALEEHQWLRELRESADGEERGVGGRNGAAIELQLVGGGSEGTEAEAEAGVLCFFLLCFGWSKRRARRER